MPQADRLHAAPDETEIERSAFNAAFYELGLRWHWDRPTYDALASAPCENSRLHRYIANEQPHLLRAYDADFLARAIIEVKTRCHRALASCKSHSVSRFDWSDARWGEVGI